MERFRSHDGDGAASARALRVATLFPQHLGFKKRFVPVVLRSRHALIERVLVSSPLPVLLSCRAESSQCAEEAG
jgi:hypothetical protein